MWQGRLLGPALVLTSVVVACGNDESANPAVLVDLADTQPGDTVGLIAVEDDDGARSVEWIDRTSAEISRLDIDGDGSQVESFKALSVGPDGDVGVSEANDQRGLLGQVVIDGRRFASWTRPGASELVIGELLSNGSQRIVWTAGAAGSGAIGGVLTTDDSGALLVGVGRNTGWDADTGVGGAILQLDPDGEPDQTETIVSTGYTNPWAYTSVGSNEIWVADNAAGPDPDDESREDVERIGRADLEPDRNDMARVEGPGRAPAAMVALGDGRIGICGFLDNQLVAYDSVDTDLGPGTGLEPAESIMPCNTGAAVFDDGTIVTAAQTDEGESLFILRP